MDYATQNKPNESVLRANVPSRSSAVMLSSSTVTGDDVCNAKDEKLGSIKDLMLDVTSGTISYAVLSFGGFLGMGDKLFAVPWRALKLDAGNKRFVLDVETDRLKDAPGFDKDHWPNMGDEQWVERIHSYYAMGATVVPNPTGGMPR